jgi:hypothetical protein
VTLFHVRLSLPSFGPVPLHPRRQKTEPSLARLSLATARAIFSLKRDLLGVFAQSRDDRGRQCALPAERLAGRR